MTRPPDPEVVLARVAAYHYVSVDDLRARTRRWDHVAWARAVAMWILHKHYGLSSPAVGDLMDRDHSTVLAGARKVEKARHEGHAGVTDTLNYVEKYHDESELRQS